VIRCSEVTGAPERHRNSAPVRRHDGEKDASQHEGGPDHDGKESRPECISVELSGRGIFDDAQVTGNLAMRPRPMNHAGAPAISSTTRPSNMCTERSAWRA
jgi:hypothetical protein